MSSATLAPPWSQTGVWEDDDHPYFESLFDVVDTPAEGQREADRTWIREEFDVLADELAAASIAVSSTRRLRSHPAYIGILALGGAAIPFLLDRLRTGEARPTWLSLLGLLTKLPPAAGAETIEEATDAWLSWGKSELVPNGPSGAGVFYAAS